MQPRLTVTALTFYRLYFSRRPGHVSQISIILSRGTLSPRPTPTPAQKHTAAVMSRDKLHKAVSIICCPPAMLWPPPPRWFHMQRAGF